MTLAPVDDADFLPLPLTENSGQSGAVLVPDPQSGLRVHLPGWRTYRVIESGEILVHQTGRDHSVAEFLSNNCQPGPGDTNCASHDYADETDPH
jgi:hypothetical protein